MSAANRPRRRTRAPIPAGIHVEETCAELDHAGENPPCRRSEGEIRRVLRLLDELETGEEAP